MCEEGMKYFKNEGEESIIVQALQSAKEFYATIRDGSSSIDVQNEMEKRITVINHFMTWTAIED